jgi:RNA polymerase sigma-70 factor (ECF subfamily)
MVVGMTARQERLVDQLGAFTAFVRRRVGDGDLAAEVVQEALAKALAHDAQLRDDDRLEAWFYRILRNTIADVVARRDRQRALPLGPEHHPLASDDESREACACLASVIAALPPQYAEVLAAVDLAGEDGAAVAGRLGISATNLKVRRHRAREALKESLERTCRLCARHGCLDCHCGPSAHARAQADGG